MPLERPRPIVCFIDDIVFKDMPRERVVYNAARTNYVPGCDVLGLHVKDGLLEELCRIEV